MRTVEKIVSAQIGQDGDGVKLFRSVGGPGLAELNPLLLLDEFCSDDAADYVGGFPSHPHRGFETVTIMLEGKMRHQDSVGNNGVIEAGGVQWMTAGRGVVHSEMPEQTEGRMRGFQLWFNLPAAQKMIAPRYQDISASSIPLVETEQAKVRVIAGEFHKTKGVVSDIVTNPTVLDVDIESDKAIVIELEGQSLVYVYDGALSVSAKRVNARQVAVLSETGNVELSGKGRALVLAAEKLEEPIARHGPFVMNTRAELMDAFEDYQSGRMA